MALCRIFKNLIATAHQKGLKVMIDVVFNHTSHDSILVNNHPEYFHQDKRWQPRHHSASMVRCHRSKIPERFFRKISGSRPCAIGWKWVWMVSDAMWRRLFRSPYGYKQNPRWKPSILTSHLVSRVS